MLKVQSYLNLQQLALIAKLKKSFIKVKHIQFNCGILLDMSAIGQLFTTTLN